MVKCLILSNQCLTIKHGIEGNMQVYGLVGQTEEDIWPEAQLDIKIYDN